jgi:hypothetical protein
MESAAERMSVSTAWGDENRGLTIYAYGARQIVWQLLEIPLHYLQIEALCKRVASAVLAETKCGREPDGQSGALTCARFSNELLRARRADIVSGYP